MGAPYFQCIAGPDRGAGCYPARRLVTAVLRLHVEALEICGVAGVSAARKMPAKIRVEKIKPEVRRGNTRISKVPAEKHQ